MSCSRRCLAAICLAAAAFPVASSSECQGASCKVEVPQDDVSLLQTKLEKADGPHDSKEAVTQDFKEAVEAGKYELRKYAEELKRKYALKEAEEAGSSLDEAMATETESEERNNAKSSLLPFDNNACPVGWDNTQASNSQVIDFIKKCLTHVKPASGKGAGNAGKDAWIRGAMDNCGGGVTNSVHHAGNQTFNVKGTAQEGGICEAKVYQVKCPGGNIPSGCTMFRAYATGNNAMGGYWGPDPTNAQMSKNEYRDAYAICNNWQGSLDKVTAATMTNKACGTLVMIGNGEKVTNCNPTSEVYPYSQYLQMIPCAARNTPGYFTTQGKNWR